MQRRITPPPLGALEESGFYKGLRRSSQTHRILMGNAREAEKAWGGLKKQALQIA